MLLLQAHDIRKYDDASAASKAAGILFEDEINRSLCTEFGTENVAKEVGLTLTSTPEGWCTNGRADYVVTLEDSSRLIAECKATRSSATAADFRAGRIKEYHLSQTTNYMQVVGARFGRIYCGVVRTNKKTGADEVSYVRCYNIEITDGKITIDGAPFHYSVEDSLNCFDVVADCYYEGRVPDRPRDYNSTWKSPCISCPFSTACEAYETTGSVPVFFNEAKQLSKKDEKE